MKDSENYQKGAKNEDQDAPAVTQSKSISLEKLDNRFAKAQNTGGDMINRLQSQYGKNAPSPDDALFGPH